MSNAPAFPVAERHDIAAELPWTQGITILDYFAAQAMQALIAKLPAVDREGEHGVKMAQADIDQMRFDIAGSAYDYAKAMCVTRDELLK